MVCEHLVQLKVNIILLIVLIHITPYYKVLQNNQIPIPIKYQISNQINNPIPFKSTINILQYDR